ncbi:uncharacterized protein E0L32_008760 [Thyridium curvatum]|uniref:Uncharacterized protein n=1 Tax=Thyridium curvatum TaxID=1093900 RepID=A0A507AJ97_9PEZI|nr:uncharacterized protein E0L32_008760 [Thyridium curvatum]TPX10355.1 hypothetical protein E0L32_008760 [Thyridium curvatum]
MVQRRVRTDVLQALLTFAYFSASCRADDHGVVFLYPPKGLTFHYLDTVNVQYTSPFDKPTLLTFCDGGGRQVYKDPVPQYNATYPVLLNFTSDTVCWFDLRPGQEPGHGANSPSFTLLSNQRVQTTLGLSISTSTSSTISSSAPIQATSAVETATNPPTVHHGLSAGASAGIGVGVALGVIAIGGGILAILWRRRKHRVNVARSKDDRNIQDWDNTGHGNGNQANSQGISAATAGSFVESQPQHTVISAAPTYYSQDAKPEYGYGHQHQSQELEGHGVPRELDALPPPKPHELPG